MFLARRAELRRIGSFVEQFCAESSVSREKCLRLNVVLEELFVNTVTHGYGADTDAPIWITLEPRAPGVEVTYEDTAPAFDPLTHPPTPPAAPDEQAPGGLGLALVRGLTASASYARIGERNRITLTVSTTGSSASPR